MKKLKVSMVIASLLLSSIAVEARSIAIKCPVRSVRTQIVTPIPNGWWQTPQVSYLSSVKISKVGNQKTILCGYRAYGSKAYIMKKVPVGYTCSVRNKIVYCTNLHITPIPSSVSMLGLWHGYSGSRSLAKLSIYKTNNRNVMVHAWGKCTPRACDWGTKRARVINRNKLVVYWNQGFVNRKMTITKVGNRLKVVTYSHYIDHSGRGDKTTVEYLHR